MPNENPSIISHVSLGTNDFEKAIAFYDKVMASIGAKRVLQFEGAAAYGKEYPEFWVQTPENEKPAEIANGTHYGFVAASKAEVHAFWDAAISMGAKPDGEPGPRPHYGEPYYGCFLRDLDGHKIEATFWDASIESEWN